jgi:hypothetical protein
MKNDTKELILYGVIAYFAVDYFSKNTLSQTVSTGIGYTVGNTASNTLIGASSGAGLGIWDAYSKLWAETYGQIFNWNNYF